VKIAGGVQRVGRDSVVNSYLFEDGGQVTIVDAAVPGLYDDLALELHAMGRTVADVRALLLTHGHTDHIGFAQRLHRTHGTPLWVHELDAALARGEVPNPAKWRGPTRLSPLLGFLWWTMRHGGLRIPRIEQVSTFGDGATLDVPGSPRVVLVPGHTAGSAALHFPAHRTLAVGDAFATYAVTSGRHGPQLAPFTADYEQAMASLDRLAGIDADLLLPGHGDEWKGAPAEAVRLVRQNTPPLR
jgi:glyoxylase-like metal-dependent hydrolase (beta-lactamase superfamily II)